MNLTTTAEQLAAARAEHADLLRTMDAPRESAQILRLPEPKTRDLFASNAMLPAPGPCKADEPAVAVTLDDFVGYLPTHSYIFKPTGEFWPKESVNANVPPMPLFDGDGNPVMDERSKEPKQKTISAATWLDRHHSVQQITWAPGEPLEVRDRLVSDGGWYEAPNRTTYNLYKPPEIQRCQGDVSPWMNHIRHVFGDEAAAHIVSWLAHRVQRPGDKINHALVLGGNPGVGKDTLLEPVTHAIGPWNFAEISPQSFFEPFNSFVKCVLLRVNEVHNLGDINRYSFYESSKIYTAAPPATLRCNEKHRRQHAVFNVCGVVMTTNHLSGGMYLPANDRRHYVAWSDLTAADFPPDYWNGLYGWFARGGNEIVAHHLMTLDLSNFDPKAPPPKTRAFWAVVDASRAPEDAELEDALDKLGKPAAVTLGDVRTKAHPDFNEWLRDRKNRSKIPHRFKECGYDPVPNPDSKQGLWVVSGARQAIYARRELCLRDQLAAAAALIKLPSTPPYPA